MRQGRGNLFLLFRRWRTHIQHVYLDLRLLRGRRRSLGGLLLRYYVPGKSDREESKGEDENQISGHAGILNEMHGILNFKKSASSRLPLERRKINLWQT